ncbi:MAG: transporter substrate-binding domain-containing protein [Thermodesulfobacteriota bacterium]
MRRTALPLLLALCLTSLPAVAAHGPDSPPPAADAPLTVSLDTDYAPFTLLDARGQPAGLFVDIWKLWSEKTGRPVRFLPLPWVGTVQAVQRGAADIHSGLFTSESRKGFLDFSAPFYHIATRLFVPVGPDAPRRLDDLAGRRVGAYRGTFQEEYLRSAFPQVETVPFDSIESEILALAAGRIRAFLGEALPVRLELQRMGLSGKVESREMHFSNTVHAGVKKGRADLLALVNQGLAAITVDEYAALEARWIGNPGERFFQPGSGRINLTPAEHAFLRRHPVLRLGVGDAFPPVMYVEEESGRKEFKGLVADYVRILSERLGVRMELRLDLTFDRALERARAGEVDLFPALVRIPERSEFLTFTPPYLAFPQVIVTRADAPFVAGLDDLAGKTAAEAPWQANHSWLVRERPEINILEAPTIPDCFRAVAFGRADAYIINLAVAGYWIPKLGLTNLKVAAPACGPDNELAMGVRRGLEPLAGILEKALASLTPAEREEIRRRWIPVQVEQAFDTRRIWRVALQAGGAAAAAMALVLLWTRQVRLREERFKGLTEQSLDITLAFAPDGRIVYQSPSHQTVLGYARDELLGTRVQDLFHPDELAALDRARAGLAMDGAATRLVHRLRRKDGSCLSFESNLADLTANRALRALVLHGRDATSRLAAEEALRRSEARYALALSSAGVGTWEWSPASGEMVWSDNVEPMLGLEPGSLGRTFAAFLALVCPEDREAVREAGQRCLAGHGEYRAEYRVLRPDGRECWILSRGDAVRDAEGRPMRLTGVLTDVTERHRLEADLVRLATLDELTRLPNRRHFLEQARREVERSRRYGSALSLLMVDVDHFKVVNDTHGHAGGDAALRALAETGRRLLRDADLMGRLGGEEFSLLLPETDLTQAVVVAERLRSAVQAMQVPLPGGGAAEVTVSVGVAALGPGGENMEELMRRADNALYAAKDRGRNRVEVF